MSYRTLFAAVLAMVIAAPMVQAQQQGAASGGGTSGGATGTDNNGGRGNRGNRGGGFDPSRLMDMFKERMAPTDDEWKVIEPKLQKVMDDRRDTMGGMFGRGGRRGGDSSSTSSDAAKSPMQQASQDLRDILDKKDATAEEINAKLTTYREARDKARQTLVSAQKDLKDVLTQRQEAVLVSMGMLDEEPMDSRFCATPKGNGIVDPRYSQATASTSDDSVVA